MDDIMVEKMTHNKKNLVWWGTPIEWCSSKYTPDLFYFIFLIFSKH